MPGYTLLASPTLYPGQEISARLVAAVDNPADPRCRLFLRVYGAGDALQRRDGPETTVAPGEATEMTWTVPDTGGHPIAEIGLEVLTGAAGPVSVALDRLGWSGAPTATFGRPADGGTLWRRAWVDGVDLWEERWPQAFRIVQNEGCALISQGTADWVDYQAEAPVAIPLAGEAGIAVRVGGQRRWYGLLLGSDGMARLVKAADGRKVLAESPFAWDFDHPYDLSLTVVGNRLHGRVDGQDLLEAIDAAPLPGGGVGLVVADGCLIAEAVAVRPVGEPGAPSR